MTNYNYERKQLLFSCFTGERIYIQILTGSRRQLRHRETLVTGDLHRNKLGK